MNYYNEIDPFAAQWLRNLIDAGHIGHGVVDTRSIEDVTPSDLANFTQCHFFAGIGLWALSLRRAGWPDSKPVWTGSCPCQPFSATGKGAGFADERHLWPALHHLISECHPPVIFGEQVASNDGLDWLDLVLADLENEDYAATAFDLCAAGFGAPHIRQRLFWVGHTKHTGLERHDWDGTEAGRWSGKSGPDAKTSRVGSAWSMPEWLVYSDGKVRPSEPGVSPLADGNSNRVGLLRAYGNAIVSDVAEGFIRSYLNRR